MAGLLADIVYFQEVNGQERPARPRALLALADLLAGTNLRSADVEPGRTIPAAAFPAAGARSAV